MFPYSDADAKVVREFADVVEVTSRAEDVITHKKSSRTVEAITVSLRFLQQQENFIFKHAKFCECMGFAAEACCFAAGFGFKHMESIEITPESCKLGYIYLKMVSEEAAATFSSAVSRFQERMAIEAEVNYLDTEHVGDLDEGLLIHSFLSCCRMIQPGNYAILVTKNPDFKLEDYDVDYLKLILPTTVAKGQSDEGYVWVLKRLSDFVGQSVHLIR